ncbi:MAG: SRPBCC family protein [Vreelandella alkaliphila]|uniref:SRPBCC family protein n=1 Tax=Halomonadaceae TaxID=28256 RepID=UPI000E8E1BE4|nr:MULTISPECIES: SRPBCC family protein [unclassified Halomonas]WKD29359.1 SRPBCC family protein [Halomonas sp. KG2]HBP41039.1 ATPase [Halomonas sp.]HBS84250.1 ATPase [Halomonas campaniensis]
MSKPDFAYVIYINTTPEQLWKALTEGEFTREYWGGRQITSEWTAGATVKLVKADGSLDWRGEVLESDPPHRLSYTFIPENDDEMPGYEGEKVDLTRPEKPSRVTFEIAEYMGQVRLTLIHDQFEESSKVLQGISVGWPFILSSLKSLLEGGSPLLRSDTDGAH